MEDMRMVSVYIKSLAISELRRMLDGTGIRFPENGGEYDDVSGKERNSQTRSN